MLLRSATQSDLPDIVAIEQDCQFDPWPMEVFARGFQLGYLGWVVEINHKVIGFIVVLLQVGECHILNLGVHSVFQHQGYGRALLAHALTAIKQKGAGMTYLEVRRSNKNAIALYDKMDFIQIGERKGYYPALKGREDALVFAKDLGVSE